MDDLDDLLARGDRTQDVLAIACSVTLSTKSRATGSATSASSRATRTSRIAVRTSASVSAPRPRRRSNTPPSRSLKLSNIASPRQTRTGNPAKTSCRTAKRKKRRRAKPRRPACSWALHLHIPKRNLGGSYGKMRVDASRTAPGAALTFCILLTCDRSVMPAAPDRVQLACVRSPFWRRGGGGALVAGRCDPFDRVGFDVPAKIRAVSRRNRSTIVYWDCPPWPFRHARARAARSADRDFPPSAFPRSGPGDDRQRTASQRGIALMLVDIDRFRAIAGSFGHESGRHAAPACRQDHSRRSPVRSDRRPVRAIASVAHALRRAARSDRAAGRPAGDPAGQPIRWPIRILAPRHHRADPDRRRVGDDRPAGPPGRLGLIAAKTRGDGRPLSFHARARRGDGRAQRDHHRPAQRWRTAISAPVRGPDRSGHRAADRFRGVGPLGSPDAGRDGGRPFLPIAEACGLSGEVSLSLMRRRWRRRETGDRRSPCPCPRRLAIPGCLAGAKGHQDADRMRLPAHRLEIEIRKMRCSQSGAGQSIVVSLKNQGIGLALAISAAVFQPGPFARPALR